MSFYKVRWDNGHACGTLSFTFDNEADADAYGRDWLMEMESATPGCVEGDYEYEVIEVEEPPPAVGSAAEILARFPDGARVRCTRVLDVYPVIWVDVGELGTVRHVEPSAVDESNHVVVQVVLDAVHPSLADWDNAVDFQGGLADDETTLATLADCFEVVA